ncbi:MAG: nucleotidyltransferase domain-containing protein [Chloroflexi bacterium]|nr:nucleotidyltransferase domain-containing protein [Chloroflexota bacterium]
MEAGTAAIPDAVREPLTALVAELVAAGAETVWLAGSFARAEAGPYSDVDVGVLSGTARGPGYRLEQRGGVLFSTSWTTAEATARSFRDPAVLGAAVPGWRRAVLLHDPSGTGGRLRDEALTFSWEPVAASCDRWAAEQVAGYAEEVHKLCNSLHRGDSLTAAVQRNVLANRLAFALSVRHRILYDTENALWSTVASAMGEPWASEQAAAFSVGGESLEASSRAALGLYVLAASEVSALLDGRQRAVVERAVDLADRICRGGGDGASRELE